MQSWFPEQIPCDHMKGSFNALYNVISYAGKTADLIAAKQLIRMISQQAELPTGHI